MTQALKVSPEAMAVHLDQVEYFSEFLIGLSAEQAKKRCPGGPVEITGEDAVAACELLAMVIESCTLLKDSNA